jgi:hypothetical protein
VIKELVKLANLLDKSGLTREANIVDNIIKKSASSKDFYDGFAEDINSIMNSRPTWESDLDPKPTLAPIEEPDMDHPVFNSGESKEGGECEEITNALLALLGTADNMDKFYDAAVNLVNTIKKLFPKHPEVDYLYYKSRDEVENKSSFFLWYPPEGLPRYEGDTKLMNRLRWLFSYVASSAYSNIKFSLRDVFIEEFGVNKECIKSVHKALVNNCKGVEDRQKKYTIESFDRFIER